MDLSIRFLILVLLGLVLGGSAQVSLNADDLLKQLETSLLELVNQVQANALNSCDLLSTCNAESTCSRLACPLSNANTTTYECQGVLQNTNCEGNCPWRNFDFSRSFLRVPGVQAVKEDYITQRQLRGICAQRNLDSLFHNHSNNTNFFRLYFGSVDGTFRIFPGMDEANCNIYDPRTRLWYLTSTTNVKKAVMVLIDSGLSMATPPGGGSVTNLEKACNITKSFLNTTFGGDYVNIFTFDYAKVESFSLHPVVVNNTSTDPDFGNFTAKLSLLSLSQGSVSSGNITDAISKVITTPAGFGSKIPPEFLKVIILITDSTAVDAISNAALPWDLIKDNNINVFLYMFPPSTATIDASPLASQLCTRRGYFEILDASILDPHGRSWNPLLALEAYYSFLANVHSTYVNSGIDYSIEYSDYSGVDNKTFTLSKAAFSNNGEFLGVVAINIFKTKLPKVYKIDDKAIEDAATRRSNYTSKFFNASAGINTTICLNKTSNKPCNQANISNIVCSSNFITDNTTMQNLSCCNCTGVTMPQVLPPTTGVAMPPVLSPTTGADQPRNVPRALGLGFGLGIPALAALAVMAWFCLRNQHPVPDVFRGDDDDDDDNDDE